MPNGSGDGYAPGDGGLERVHPRSMSAHAFSLASSIRNRFLRQREAVEGVQTIELYRRYMYHLRPWHPKPSPIILEELERRNQWRLHPPSMALVIHLVVVVVPLFVGPNAELLRLRCVSPILPAAASFILSPPCGRPQLLSYFFHPVFGAIRRWWDLSKPEWLAGQEWALLSSLVFCQILCAFAVWFAYIAEGWGAIAVRLCPYGVFLLLQCLWPDLLFGIRNPALALLLMIVATALLAFSTLIFFCIVRISGIFLALPLLFLIYCDVILSVLVHMNPSPYPLVLPKQTVK
eukprot:gene5430-967_t